MQARKEQNQHISNFINNTINDLKNLTSALRSLNRHSADVNNSIINKLLLANDRDSLEIIKDVLGHLLHIVDFKGMNTLILSILTKVISYIKLIEEEQIKSEQKLFPCAVYAQEMSNIMYHVIDIIFLLKNKNKDFDMILRIIQTTFSLIDTELLKYVNYHIITRFMSNPMIQNISTSALFALTQIIFASTKTDDTCTILTQFLQYLFANKKFSWIKDQQFKYLVWDLIIVGIRSFPTCEIELLSNNKTILSLINQMYKISLQKVFSNQDLKSIKHSKLKKHQHQKNSNVKKGIYSQFIRYYKSFVFLSIHLSIKPHHYHLQLVPFKQNIYLFKLMYQLERDAKLYLLLEGISLLIIEGSNLLVEDERAILMLDIFSKIIEELCLGNIQVELSSDVKDLYLEKMCGDFNRITDSDFVKLTRNSIIKLRKKFEGKIDKTVKTGQLLTERTQLSQKSEPQLSEGSASSSRKKWQKLINNVISIIRYLTSLNMKQTPNEQLVRKIIIQLQYWYLICPSVKTRNFILQELMSTSTLIDTKMQAMKVSQCVQIGSNIIYGYYDSLDAIGLTIILKMMAGVKTSWEDGRGFEQLDQVCTMSQKLYIQQNLVHSDKSFTKTIQAFVQCVNSLLADLQLPNRQQKIKKGGRTSLEKICKMTQYVFGKLEIILDQNVSYIHDEWNFLTSFWISLCSNRNTQIKQRTMNHIGSVIVIILNKSEIKQELILSTYLELSKLQILDISRLVITQLKQILLSINSEEAIIEICRIIKLVLQSKICKPIVNDVYQLHQMVVKQLIFKVKSTNNLIFIIESFNSLSQDKNEEYKTVNLIWNISDHLKILAQKEQLADIQKIWRKLFGKLYLLSLHSVHGETKQSCIHTFTQILAQSTAILKVDEFLSIIKEIYLPVFYVLMCINQQSPKLQNVNQFETVKVAIKNIIKIIKKCKNDGIDKQFQILNEILTHIATFIGNIDSQVSIQYQFELCTLLQFIKSLQKGKQQGIPGKNIQAVLDFLKKMEIHHSRFDQTSLMWRKKYEPAFKELKSYFIN